MCRILRAAFSKKAAVGLTDTHTLQPGVEGTRFEIIPPSGPDDYLGPLRMNPRVKPNAIGGTWLPAGELRWTPPSAADSGTPGSGTHRTVALHLHGGAFIWGDGRTACSGFLAEILQAMARVDAVLSIQYRLSAFDRTNPFPAALAYVHLVRGLPRCAVFVSPMLAPRKTAGPGPTPYARHPNVGTDFVPVATLRWGWQVYAGDTFPGGVVEAAAREPYFMQLGHAFATPVPLFVTAGTRELFLPDVEEWVAEMRDVPGNRIVFYREEDALHDTLLLGRVLGFERSAREVAARAGEFIHESL